MKKWIRTFLIVLAVIIAGMAAASFFVDEPLRRSAEDKANQVLPGFDVKINRLSVHPFSLSVDLEEVVVRQRLHPDPPVIQIPRIRGGLRRLSLLTGRIVLEAQVERPKFFIDLDRLKPLPDQGKETADRRVEEAPWQDRISALPRFTVAEFRVLNGEAAFVPGKDLPALKIAHVDFAARNIGNRPSTEDRTYPSEISIESAVSGSGRLRMSGKADLLRKPVMAARADVEVQKFELTALKTIAERNHVIVEKGTVSATGGFEFSQAGAVFVVKEALLDQPAVDFVYSGLEAKEKVKRAKETAKEKGKEATNEPGLLIRVNRLRITGGNFGVVNKAATPDYRIFMTNTDLLVNNFSNQFREGPADVHLRGQFMGTGDTTVTAAFRPEKQGPDFTVRTAIKETNMRAMNDLFRAYGKFDVSEGLFSLYSELSVGSNKIKGYVKPLFRNMKVYDRRSDDEKSAFRKLYEKIIGGAIKLLENLPREEVATETPIEGTIEDPEASTWEVLENLVQNAFFRAILPGFESSVKGASR